MSSNKELKVILSKVEWCGHCKDFLPVFNESKNLIKNNNMFKNVSVDFEVYDMEQDKGIFETKYGELVDKVEGYPTVFLAQIKNDKLSKTVEIGHAKEPEDFIKLIDKAYKTFSNQKGGFEEEEIYKLKYLKYKAKYTKLKTQFGGENRFTLIIKRKYQSGYHFHDYAYNFFIIDNQKPADIDTFTLEQNIIYTYANIVGFKTMSGLFQWPIKFNSGWVKGSSRDNNYKYQQEYEKKFMDKINETYDTRKSDFPFNYEAILEISFD
jgi:hypothetical protein